VNNCTLSIVTVALMLTAFFSHSAVPAQATPSRPLSSCLDPNRARSWHHIDSDEILVDAGRQRFHLRLATSCPELDYNHTLVFRSGHGVGRICGNSGDTLLFSQRDARHFPCRIVEVNSLSKDDYRVLLNHHKPQQGVVEVRNPDDKGDSGKN